jgi:hypothetical protein
MEQVPKDQAHYEFNTHPESKSMFLRVLEFILLAPFKVFAVLVDAIFFPPKTRKYVEEINHDLIEENRRLKRVLDGQVNQNSVIESEMIRMNRDADRNTKQQRNYYEAKIRELERELSLEQERKVFQQ